jgi:MFS transporter, OFA family, oxalate/formate antiporter
METSSKTRKGIFYGWWVLAALVIVGSTGPMARYSTSAFFPAFSSELGWSRSLIGTAQSISLWSYSILSIFTGFMIDRVGGRKTIFLGGILCTAGWLLISTIHSTWQLFIYYGLVMGAAVSFTHLVCVQSISRKWFVKRGGLAGGIVGSAFALGTAIFSPVLTSLAADFGWRNVSLVAAFASGIPIILLAYFVIRDTPETVGLHPDDEFPSVQKGPVVKRKTWNLKGALKTRQFGALFVAYSLIGVVYNGLLGHLVIWAVDLGSTSAAAGIFVTLFNGPSIAARIFGGIMGDRHSKHRIIIIGTFCTLIIILLGFVGTTSPVMLGVFVVATGLAIGFSNTLFAPYLGDLFGRENVGSLFGILTLGWGLIGGVGPMLWGELHDRLGSYKPALLISAICYMVAVATLFIIKPLKTKAENQNSEPETKPDNRDR